MKVSPKYIGMPYWIGGIILGILNIGLFWFSSKPWGVTTAISHWGANFLRLFGAEPDKWLYFSQLQLQNGLGEYQFFLSGSLLNFGIVLGSFIAANVNNEFRVRWARQKKQYFAGIIGGILMGYGARLAGGCSVGAFVSGTASLSLHGFVFGTFLFAGVWLGLQIVQKIFNTKTQNEKA
jgi:uncharacterized protein